MAVKDRVQSAAGAFNAGAAALAGAHFLGGFMLSAGTLASGTAPFGAAAVAACLNGLCGRSVAVTLPGGTLQIEWSEEDGHVYLTGPATFVYDGVWLQDDLQKQGRTEKHAQGQSQL